MQRQQIIATRNKWITRTPRVAPPHEVPEEPAEGRLGGLQLVEGGQAEADGFLRGPALDVVEAGDGGGVSAGGGQGVHRVRRHAHHLHGHRMQAWVNGEALVDV